jgi:2-oxoacid:acceptor oxidoreductase gamma subunit (pyruvate/2-ketoisovalerate family)
MMLEVRLHGRGGQGVVSAARLMAEATIEEGRHAQAFPEFGAERSGAPIAAYARLSDEPIEIRSLIYEPDVVMVVDRSMVAERMVASGLKEGGVLIVNFDGDPVQVRRDLDLRPAIKVWAVDATGIALKTIGKDFPNTPMLGAMARATGALRLEALVPVFEKRFKGALQERNVKALKCGYEEVKAG